MISLRFNILLLALATALTILTTSVSAQQCSSTSLCPASAPCCSSYGYCGGNNAHCLGGCDPVSSFKPSSCKPMPKCKPMRVDFTNYAKPYIASSSYRGDPNQAPFTLDQGTIVPARTGAKLLLTKDGDAKKGTLLSSTRYWYYGRASAVMKHGSWAGVVNTFIGMSGTKDEIDWEFTTASPLDVETNYYWFGQPEGYTHGFTVPQSTLFSVANGFSVADWHTYTLDWSPNRLRWIIDGATVRTLYRKHTYNAADGLFHYPSSPMRLQLSIWGAGDGTFPQGTTDWAGGLIDWSKATNGRFVNMVKQVEISCNDPDDVKNDRPNYAFSDKTKNSQNGQPKTISTTRSSILS